MLEILSCQVASWPVGLRALSNAGLMLRTGSILSQIVIPAAHSTSTLCTFSRFEVCARGHGLRGSVALTVRECRPEALLETSRWHQGIAEGIQSEV